jgi:hypothetical protein
MGSAGAISEALDEGLAHHIGRFFHQSHFLDALVLGSPTFHPPNMRDQVRSTIEAHCQFCQNFGQVENRRKDDHAHLTISEGQYTLTVVNEKVESVFKLEDMDSILVRGQTFRITPWGQQNLLE